MTTRVLLAAALLLLAACAAAPPPRADPALVFVVVRHAEKSNDDPRDPSLSAPGRERAARLAERLRDAPLVAAWSSDYRRTRDTAAAAAALHDLPVRVYDAREPAHTLVARLRAEHDLGTVLVVGHSNTVPGIVASLCGCVVEPLADDEYGAWFELRPDAAGVLRLTHDRY
jgi:broad specificity phosphatase PhoE